MDLRERALALLERGKSSIEVGEQLDVSDSWVRKIRLRLAILGEVAPGTPPGKPRKLTEKQEEKLCLLSLEHPDATLAELADLAKRRMAVSLSISTISRRLIEMGMTRKKRASMRRKRSGTTSCESANPSTTSKTFRTPEE
jgi:transposase